MTNFSFSIITPFLLHWLWPMWLAGYFWGWGILVSFLNQKAKTFIDLNWQKQKTIPSQPHPTGLGVGRGNNSFPSLESTSGTVIPPRSCSQELSRVEFSLASLCLPNQSQTWGYLTPKKKHFGLSLCPEKYLIERRLQTKRTWSSQKSQV